MIRISQNQINAISHRELSELDKINEFIHIRQQVIVDDPNLHAIGKVELVLQLQAMIDRNISRMRKLDQALASQILDPIN